MDASVQTRESNNATVYYLPGDEKEANRLQLQHWVFKEIWWKGRDQLFAPVDLKNSSEGSPIRVLDAAAGTGIWSLELAQGCPPTTTFTLLDYNPKVCEAVYPHLPHNVQLHAFDLLSDFQKYPEWQNGFDLVHQRSASLAFTPEQWRAVLQNFFNVLKPGAYLQLWEPEPATEVDEHSPLGKWHAFAVPLLARLCQDRGIKLDIIGDLPRLLQETGFENVQTEQRQLDLTCKPQVSEPRPNAVASWYKDTWTATCQKAHEVGLIGDEDWQNWQEGLSENVSESEINRWTWRAHAIVAQKPVARRQ